LAEPPAESPSTRKSSLWLGSVLEQSASLPGRLRRWLIAVLRETCWLAARLASRARAAATMRATMDSAIDELSSSHCSRAVRTTLSTCAVTSGLLRRSLVCPWN
jgi:hypothetical protein